ncbi:MAG: universal stress protein [Bryobacterales bacterium]|nr:universal stress protein [Bryobacterales bacterium]
MPNGRPSPEELLRRIEAEEQRYRRGSLKIFLGYASGVGKSFRMLDEGRRRRERGQDVVVGALQPELSEESMRLAKQLEIIPLKQVDGSAVVDIDAILKRHPAVCLIDGLAYDNPPGSAHPHRWNDVQQLLDAGISVITTVNLQFVEERRREVEEIRGKSVDVSIPESFLRQADEIVLVDAPAEECTDDTEVNGLAAEHENKMSRLREIALLLAADVVEHQLGAHLERNGSAAGWATQERILVCLTPRTKTTRMMQRASVIRERFHGELFAISVSQPKLTQEDQEALERNLEEARGLGAEVHIVEGDDAVEAILSFARERGITQIFTGHSIGTGWRSRFLGSNTDRLIRGAKSIDVKLFPH